jgi:hypothetical protein
MVCLERKEEIEFRGLTSSARGIVISYSQSSRAKPKLCSPEWKNRRKICFTPWRIYCIAHSDAKSIAYIR